MSTPESPTIHQQHTEILVTLAGWKKEHTREEWEKLPKAKKAAAALELAELQIDAEELRLKIMSNA